jgi:8-oxo-dGTP pyrophosphatase MutT (NUDIX family)
MARVVVAAVVHRPRQHSFDEEYLITQRPPDATFFPNVWVLPGGGVELSDYEAEDDGTAPLHAALYRELREECGTDLMTFTPPRLLCERTFIRGDGEPVLVLSYLMAWFGGECELSKEVVNFAWVTSYEAGDYNLIGTTLEELGLADNRV